MVLAKLVDVVPLPEGGTATRCRGWYLVQCGECVRVELWNVYTPRVMKSEEEQAEENARIAKKQKNNWRKLELLPYVICEGKEELFALIQKSKEETRKEACEESVRNAKHQDD